MNHSQSKSHCGVEIMYPAVYHGIKPRNCFRIQKQQKTIVTLKQYKVYSKKDYDLNLLMF